MGSASIWNIMQLIITDVLRQLIRPIFKWQETQEEILLAGYRDPWRGIDKMYRNVSKELQLHTA
jgi:hypothetical protein